MEVLVWKSRPFKASKDFCRSPGLYGRDIDS
jgi:hypothetical protein